MLKQTGDLTENILGAFDTLLNDYEVKTKIEELFHLGKEQLKNHLKEKEIPFLVKYLNKKLDEIFNNPEKISKISKKIEELLLKTVPHFEGYLKLRLTPEFIENTIQKLKVEESVYSIVYKSIMKQDMEEFEKLTKKIMSDNLAFIEIVGGILGMFIGFALIYKITLIIIPSVILIFLLTDNFLTKVFVKNLQQKTKNI